MYQRYTLISVFSFTHLVKALLIGSIVYFSGCSKANIRYQPMLTKDALDKLPVSKKPHIASTANGRLLRYIVSNNSGRTFHRIKFVILGTECQGKHRQEWEKYSRQPLVNRTSQRYQWKMPVYCKSVKVLALSDAPQKVDVNLTITAYRPPFLRYKIQNTSKSKTYKGFIIKIDGFDCANDHQASRQTHFSPNPIRPGNQSSHIIQMKEQCEKVRLRLSPLSKHGILHYSKRPNQHLHMSHQKQNDSKTSPHQLPQNDEEL